MITISGKNFSFQATQIKNGTSITISSSGEIKFNTVALEAKMQSANKSDSYQSKSGVNFSHSKSDQSRSEPSARNPEVTRGKPFPGGGQPPRVVEPLPKAPEVINFVPAEEVILPEPLEPLNGEFQVVDTKPKPEITNGNPFPGGGPPPRVVEPLPKAPEVIELMPAEEVILGDALEPPNGEFQVLGSRPKIEPTNNILRDFARTPSLDDIQFIETDLSRKLAAEEAGTFDDDLISITGLQPEVVSSAPLEKPQGIILGDALDPPNGEFQVVDTKPKPEITKGNPFPGGGQPPRVVEPLPKAPEVINFVPAEEVVLPEPLEPLNGEFQVVDTKPKPEVTPDKKNIFNFIVSSGH